MWSQRLLGWWFVPSQCFAAQAKIGPLHKEFRPLSASTLVETHHNIRWCSGVCDMSTRSLWHGQAKFAHISARGQVQVQNSSTADACKLAWRMKNQGVGSRVISPLYQSFIKNHPTSRCSAGSSSSLDGATYTMPIKDDDKNIGQHACLSPLNNISQYDLFMANTWIFCIISVRFGNLICRKILMCTTWLGVWCESCWLAGPIMEHGSSSQLFFFSLQHNRRKGKGVCWANWSSSVKNQYRWIGIFPKQALYSVMLYCLYTG